MGRDPFELVRWFDDLFDMGFGMMTNTPIHFDWPQYPPMNVSVRENKDVRFEFALAGYSQSEVDLSFAGDHMVLKAERKNQQAEGEKYLHMGIKSAKIESKYYVPSEKYDAENTEAVWKDGLLVVTIPSREKKETKKVSIKKL
jgi:HSP20 family molecular chaperone IbpA